MKPPAGIVVPEGIRNFWGTERSSVRYQLPKFAGVGPGLCNSIASTAGGSVCVRTSLIQTSGMLDGGSSAPGDPPARVLARQFAGLFGSELMFGLKGTSEKPPPSAAGGQGVWSL